MNSNLPFLLPWAQVNILTRSITGRVWDERSAFSLVVSLMILLGGGCATAANPKSVAPAIDVTGIWTGSAVVSGTHYPMSLRLQQVGAKVTGTENVAGDPGSAAFSGPVEGVVSGNQFTFRTAAGAGGDVVVNGDDMTGFGSKAGAQLILRRQK